MSITEIEKNPNFLMLSFLQKRVLMKNKTIFITNQHSDNHSQIICLQSFRYA